MIEICFEVNIVGSLAFWIDKAKWEGMSADEKQAEIDKQLDSAAASTQEPIILDGVTNLCITLDSQDKGVPVQEYDPES